jgi:hypothetical protein
VMISSEDYFDLWSHTGILFHDTNVVYYNSNKLMVQYTFICLVSIYLPVDMIPNVARMRRISLETIVCCPIVSSTFFATQTPPTENCLFE